MNRYFQGVSLGLITIAIGLGSATAGCGSSSSQVTPQSASPQLPELGDPAAALPDGAQWVVVAEPRRAFADPNFGRLLAVLLPERRLDSWKERYAIDLRRVDKLAVGAYEDGSLLVARGGFDAGEVVRAAVEAMDLTETVATTPHERAAGLIGGRRYLLASAAQDGLVLGEGAPESWGRLLRYLDGDPSAVVTPGLAGAPLRELAEAQAAPLALHVLAPLDLPGDAGVGVILAGTEQIALTLAPDGDSRVSLWLSLHGRFPTTIEDNLRRLAESLAQEPLGAALGIGEAIPSLRVSLHDNQQTVTAELSLTTARLARGLELLFGADLWRLIEPETEPPEGAN